MNEDEQPRGSGWMRLPLAVRVLSAVVVSSLPLVIGYIIGREECGPGSTEVLCGVGAFAKLFYGFLGTIALLMVTVGFVSGAVVTLRAQRSRCE